MVCVNPSGQEVEQPHSIWHGTPEFLHATILVLACSAIADASRSSKAQHRVSTGLVALVTAKVAFGSRAFAPIPTTTPQWVKDLPLSVVDSLIVLAPGSGRRDDRHGRQSIRRLQQTGIACRAELRLIRRWTHPGIDGRSSYEFALLPFDLAA
jgi:hypothetical protein